MADSSLAIRFTEDKYATKNEVARDLKVLSADTFWANILAYRSNFYHYLTVKTIEKNMLVFCGCPAINTLVNNVEMKLIRANREYSMIQPTSKQYQQLASVFGKDILRILNNIEQLGVEEPYIESVYRREVISAIPNNMLLVNYLKALTYVKRAYVNPINEDFLANLYSKLLGTEELVEFYRQREDRNPENRVLIDRIYTSAPVNLIEPMMNNLFTFIASSTLSTSLKAIIAFFYINYVKPFSKYSEEMAVLVAKAVLAHEAFGETVVDFPLEKILTLPVEEVARIYVEVQKTSDITYFVSYISKYLGQYCDGFLDEITKSKVITLREDYYQVDQEQDQIVIEEKEPVIQPNDAESIVLFNENDQENKDEVEQKEELPLNEVEKPEIPQPKKKTVKVAYVQEELAVAYIPVALDEKQAVLLEQDLLERDPELKKGEAKFYARHCTKGKKYTIAQYKKSLRCAYETARTSMDHLAKLNYYRKESVKNKFVYIPVEKEEND